MRCSHGGMEGSLGCGCMYWSEVVCAKYLLWKGAEDAAKKSLLSAAEMIRAGELANIGNDLFRKLLDFGAR